jgi:NTP pyrophosphatase (non-canonical NTP hydrolase)
MFGWDSLYDPKNRAERLLEEAIEVSQAVGMTEARARELVSKVYARPAGRVEDEVGGVGLTLLALCASIGVSADAAEAKEAKRVHGLSQEFWRERHKAKLADGRATVPVAP